MIRDRFADPGTVYLIHFDERIGGPGSKGAQHYLGWAADDPNARLEHHRRGLGARILAYCVSKGIGFDIVRTWDGDRHLERRMKNRGHFPEICPTCAMSKELAA